MSEACQEEYQPISVYVSGNSAQDRGRVEGRRDVRLLLG